MLTLEIMLLVWLQNIYLTPGRITVRLATSKIVNGLIDAGYVTYNGQYIHRTYITPKGKRFLMRNIHLIPFEEEEKVFVEPTDALIGLPTEKVLAVADFKGNDVSVLEFKEI